MKQALIVLWLVCLCLLVAYLNLWGLYKATSKSCAKPVAWDYQLAPHEQQPEPMMAKQGFSVERWVL